MVNSFILFIFSALFVGMFSIGFQYTSVNRIFVNTPKEVFEMSLKIDESDEHIFYFSDTHLKDSLTSYYEQNIKHYVNDFSFELTYLNEEDEFCFDDKCKKVKVNFEASLAFSYTYQKSIFYEIRRMTNG